MVVCFCSVDLLVVGGRFWVVDACLVELWFVDAWLDDVMVVDFSCVDLRVVDGGFWVVDAWLVGLYVVDAWLDGVLDLDVCFVDLRFVGGFWVVRVVGVCTSNRVLLLPLTSVNIDDVDSVNVARAVSCITVLPVHPLTSGMVVRASVVGFMAGAILMDVDVIDVAPSVMC